MGDRSLLGMVYCYSGGSQDQGSRHSAALCGEPQAAFPVLMESLFGPLGLDTAAEGESESWMFLRAQDSERERNSHLLSLPTAGHLILS